MAAMGNGTDKSLLGIVSGVGDSSWIVVARYEASGYIRDDDAREWNVDELYKSLQEGTEEGNKRRKDMGIAPLQILGWVQKPHYDASTHRLVWSLAAKGEGQADEAQSVNFNTYALGRGGYISLNLITARTQVERDKAAVNTLLSGLRFNEGRRYEEFNAGTDRVAEYGLAALVAGVAAKKLGLIAVALAFAAKFAKVLLLGAAGIGAVATRVFKGRKAAP
jgi:uncharacterized membrane-anchored protein